MFVRLQDDNSSVTLDHHKNANVRNFQNPMNLVSHPPDPTKIDWDEGKGNIRLSFILNSDEVKQTRVPWLIFIKESVVPTFFPKPKNVCRVRFRLNSTLKLFFCFLIS